MTEPSTEPTQRPQRDAEPLVRAFPGTPDDGLPWDDALTWIIETEKALQHASEAKWQMISAELFEFADIIERAETILRNMSLIGRRYHAQSTPISPGNSAA